MDNIQEVQDNPPVPTPAPVRQKRKRHRQNTLLPQRPKKPATGYTMFLRNYFSTHPTQDGISARDLLGHAGQEWRSLTPQQKEQYQELCKADVQQYRNKMELWNRQKEIVKRPCSAYALFVKDYYARAKDANQPPKGHVTEVGKKIKEEWDALAQDVKSEYMNKYHLSLFQYCARMLGIESGVINIENLVNGVQPGEELGAGLQSWDEVEEWLQDEYESQDEDEGED